MPDLEPLLDVDTAPLFAPLRTELVTLLRSLGAAEWDAPTVAGAWRVRDVVAHMVDGELRTLAAHRDGHALAAEGTIHGYDDVLTLVHRLNAEGVVWGGHASPRLLTDLLEVTGTWMSAFLATLDPDAPARFAVAWAGEAVSTNRFDTAREYTERWHHQMQIRLAVGERGQPKTLLVERYAGPLLETAMRALPYAYRGVAGEDGSAVVLSVDSTGMRPAVTLDRLTATLPWRRAWTLRLEGRAWRIYSGAAMDPTARVTGSADAWWRLLFNALPPGDVRRAFVTEGQAQLLPPLWRARSVMV
jgi:hypothetical protein